MLQRIPAVNVRGELRDVREYNLTVDDIGRWAVIQWGYTALGTGETREEAIAEAASVQGIAYDDEGNEIDFSDSLKQWPDYDGDATVDQIVEARIDEDGNIINEQEAGQ